MPDADDGVAEGDYNRQAATATGALCLDAKLVTKSIPDKMEVCDLLTHDRQLVHVKKRGRSSTLSHLFNQGMNCGELLFEDQGFREEAREIVRTTDTAFADVLPADRPQTGEYEYAFVVITRSKRDSPLTLPFFSLVSLRTAARRLQNLGYKVSAKAVPEGRARS